MYFKPKKILAFLKILELMEELASEVYLNSTLEMEFTVLWNHKRRNSKIIAISEMYFEFFALVVNLPDKTPKTFFTTPLFGVKRRFYVMENVSKLLGVVKKGNQLKLLLNFLTIFFVKEVFWDRPELLNSDIQIVHSNVKVVLLLLISWLLELNLLLWDYIVEIALSVIWVIENGEMYSYEFFPTLYDILIIRRRVL